MKITVILVDDHEIMRNGLRRLLDKDENIEVVGEASTGRMAIDLTLKLKPDVVVMDISMPDLSGIEATRQIISQLPDVKVIALSMYPDTGFVTGMLAAGASGYMLKDCAYKDLINAIHDVNQDKVYLSSQIADSVDIKNNYKT